MRARAQEQCIQADLVTGLACAAEQMLMSKQAEQNKSRRLYSSKRTKLGAAQIRSGEEAA